MASKGLKRQESTEEDTVAADLPRCQGLAGAGSKTPDSFPRGTAFQSHSGLPAGLQTFQVRAGWTRQVSKQALCSRPSLIRRPGQPAVSVRQGMGPNL